MRSFPVWNLYKSRCVPRNERVVSDEAPLTDAPLIAQALAGRSEAFGQLVLMHQDRLFNSILHVAGNAEDARDICQEAFVQAFLKLEQFQQRSAFSTWLYRIAFNVAASQRRRRHPVASMDRLREQSHVEPVDTTDDPAEAFQRKERQRCVRESIAQLGDEFRSVLVLREIDGCDYETIAEILDLPVGTVRSRLHRARLQLREALREGLELQDS